MTPGNKRRGLDAGIDSQQRREDFENEDSDNQNDDGNNQSNKGFDIAEPAVLKNRQIFSRKARKSGIPNFGKAEESKPMGNLFGGVNLLSNSTTPSTTDFKAPSSTMFLGLNSTPSTSMSTIASPGISTVASKPTSGNSDNGIAALNSSFAKFIDENATGSKLCIAAAKDYIVYAKSVCEITFDKAAPEKPEVKPAAIGGLFSQSTPSVTPTLPTPTPASSGGLFGSFPSSGATSGFFGGQGSSSTTTSLFGGAMSSFGAKKTGGEDNGGDEENDDGDDDDEETKLDEPNKVEDNIRDDEVEIIKLRAKIMSLQGQQWTSKGTGDMSLLEEKSSKRVFLVLRSGTGRITCNIPLYKGLKVNADAAKKVIMFAAISYSGDNDEDAKPDTEAPVPFQIRVKTSEEATKLQEAITNAVK